MKVILLDNVRGIGQVGDIKEVSDGYARNFLLPRKVAKAVTEGVIKDVAGLKAKKLEVRALAHTQSVALAAKLSGMTVVLHGKTNEKGTLFSSISETDIAGELSKQVQAHIPSSAVLIDGHIKTSGSHAAKIKLSDDVVTDIVVDVQPIV